MEATTRKWLDESVESFNKDGNEVTRPTTLLEMQKATGLSHDSEMNAIIKKFNGTHEIYNIKEKDVPLMYVERARKNAGKKNLPVILFVHGGGGVMGSGIELLEYKMNTLTESQEMIAISMDYRLAPKNKMPAQQQDVTKVLQYIKKNAAKLGIDKNRICVYGISAGGTFSLGALSIMQQEQPLDVKLLILEQPMLSDTIYKVPLHELNKAENYLRPYIQSFYNHLFSDIKKQDDPLNFPGQMSVEQAKKLPPTVLVTSEYDIFRRDAYDFKKTLQKAQKLVDFSDYATVSHGFDKVTPRDSIINIQFEKDLNVLLRENLIN